MAKAEIIRRLNCGEKVAFCTDRKMAEVFTARDVGIAAEDGEPVAEEILRMSGRYLGVGLSILINILNPERIIIGSVFARSREFIQPAAEEIIRAEALKLSYENCVILPAGLGEKIGDYACLSVASGDENN